RHCGNHLHSAHLLQQESDKFIGVPALKGSRMSVPDLGKLLHAGCRAACRTVAWITVGAALGGAVLGIFGILYGVLGAVLKGDPGFVLSAVGSLMMAGAAAGGLTAAGGLLLDGHSPLSHDLACKATVSGPTVVHPGASSPEVPEPICARLHGV